MTPGDLTSDFCPLTSEPDPCPRLLAETQAEMVRRTLDILKRDPEAELLAVQTELTARYGFAPELVEARAARILAQARRLRADRAVKRAQGHDEAAPND